MRNNRMLKPCIEDGCDTPQRARGLCSTHYSRERRGIPLNNPIPKLVSERDAPQPWEKEDSCTVFACNNFQKARGWCNGHYTRWQRRGDVFAHIPLGGRAKIVPCAAEECTLPALCRGMCETHYWRDRTWGDLQESVPVHTVNFTRTSKNSNRDIRKAKIQKGVATSYAPTYKDIFDSRCAYCNRTVLFEMISWKDPRFEKKASVDHILPLVSNGTHDWDNVVLSCWRCNSVKGSRSLSDFLALLQCQYSNISDFTVENIRALQDVLEDIEKHPEDLTL